MELKQIYNEILTEHNRHPWHKGKIESPDMELDGVNPSCGDSYKIQLKLKDGIVVDGGFTGEGCAISKASVDVMLDLIIGKTKDEALHLSELFRKMVQGETNEPELEELDEAAAFKDISHMPARVKCAVLGWHTLNEMLADD